MLLMCSLVQVKLNKRSPVVGVIDGELIVPLLVSELLPMYEPRTEST